jgi:hypothetical protein
MHAKSPRDLRFGQEAIAWPERTAANLGLQSFHDLTPECDTGIVLQIHVRPPQGRDAVMQRDAYLTTLSPYV